MSAYSGAFLLQENMLNSVVGMVPDPKGEKKAGTTMNALWKNRASFNKKAVSMMKENAFSKDMVELAKDDAEKGFMTKPQICTPKSRRNILASRRIPVRE